MLKKKNIFRMELWLFVLIFLIIFSGVSMAQEAAKDSENLQKIALCKDILEKNPLRQTNFFLPQDEKVVTWLRFSYDSPDWYWIKIKGNYASQLPGEWKVKVYINDIFLAERNFFIVGPF